MQLDDVDVLGAEAGLLRTPARAAFRLMSAPTRLIALLVSKVERMSVTIAWPTISTAWSAEAVLLDEALAGEHRGAGAVGGGRALQPGQPAS